MPKIRCLYVGCIYLESGYCTAPLVNIDPDEGCLTFTQLEDPFDGGDLEESDWDDELDGFEEWEEDETFDDEWLDDDLVDEF